ncbi:MAG TPA: TraR/DksA family transcriptional regulator [Acidobacteriota bacterium]|jgi:DnaK suppressor protein|nr:TraR/DksA family transcriptional regulator [Acidobacteriota bacterium]
MPFLKKSQVGKYHKHLEQVRDQIVAKMQRTANDGRDETLLAETNDSGDLALSSYTKEFLYKLSNVERGQFVQIEAALRRVQEGTYGECIDCGNPLPTKRLDVIPWASRCMACQEIFEQLQAEQEEENVAVANI